MNTWQRRAVGYTVFLFIAIGLTAAAYQRGMRVYENDPRTYVEALQFAVEMYTTTGFGSDSPWTSPQMNVFVTVMDLVGMGLLVGAQGSPFVSESSPGERSWNGGQWTHFSAKVTDVGAFRAAVAANGPFASSERILAAEFIEVTLGRPGFGPPNFFLCPLNGRA